MNLLLKRTVHVVRDARLQEIEQTEIVAGDLIRLERGDQIAVDGRVRAANHLGVDESLLTGESVPVFKQTGDEVLSGSFCVAGNGFYAAEKVGDEAYAAKVTNAAKQFKIHLTPLQRKLSFVVKALFAASLVLVALELVFGANDCDSEADFVRRLATLVISLVPHGLILMSSVTFALDVYRISQTGRLCKSSTRLNLSRTSASSAPTKPGR